MIYSRSTSNIYYFSYRKLALKYHPDNDKSPGADKKFDEIGESYDVLSSGELQIEFRMYSFSFVAITAATKARYDKFGEEGLKGGVPTADQDFIEGYTFHGNSKKVFSDFFGGDNPFSGKITFRECMLCA